MNGWDDEYEEQQRWRERGWVAFVFGSRFLMWFAIAVIIIGVLVVLLAGCGTGRNDKLENSVRGYTSEILGGDANKAYDRVSARCQERIGRHLYTEVWASTRKEWTGSPGIRSYTASIEGDRAEVTYRFENPVWDQEREAWIWESGKWVNDEC